MARLKAADRNALPSDDFAGPDRSYPIPDKPHAANAKARSTQAVKAGRMSPAEKSKIDAKANNVLGETKMAEKSLAHHAKAAHSAHAKAAHHHNKAAEHHEKAMHHLEELRGHHTAHEHAAPKRKEHAAPKRKEHAAPKRGPGRPRKKA